MREKQRIAIITGASRGIGKAIATELTNQGCFIIGTAFSEQGVKQIEDECKAGRINGRAYQLDISSADSIKQFLEDLEGQWPAILINNAGITNDNLLLRMKEEEWCDVVNTNLNSLYYLCKACLRPMMKARYGRIINISSVVGLSGNGGQSNYAAAKAGMLGFTRSLAQEVASRQITVNAVAPGFIETDMVAELSAEYQENIISQIPLQRLGRAKEVAALVAFLASDEATYITGETINISGGLYMG